ncbi:MAG: hypothetical protein M3Z02_01235 [Actinomycetota bacterium]|nr:hypothetical protein [Actinomycetota bacterium]
MLFTSHLLTGAVNGGVVGSPAAAGVLGVASHVAMDVVPHRGDKAPARFLAVAGVDGLAGLVVGTAAALLAASRERRVSVLAGMAGAELLDLDEPARHFIGAALSRRRSTPDTAASSTARKRRIGSVGRC